MGNHAITGYAMNLCGITEVLGFEESAKALINMHGIVPWNARSLVKDNLARQGELARRSPLRFVPVEDGLAFMKSQMRSWFIPSFSRDQFVSSCIALLRAKTVPLTKVEQDDLYLIFDSMDFDKNGYLSVGEWAAGLSVFFRGSTEQAVHAVFTTLDTDCNRSLSKLELQAYLSPFVKAMTPWYAGSLRPLLEKKAVEDIFWEMDMNHHASISSSEMIAWTKRGNNIVDKLADIIDREVYQIWLREHQKRRFAPSIDTRLAYLDAKKNGTPAYIEQRPYSWGMGDLANYGIGHGGFAGYPGYGSYGGLSAGFYGGYGGPFGGLPPRGYNQPVVINLQTPGSANAPQEPNHTIPEDFGIFGTLRPTSPSSAAGRHADDYDAWSVSHSFSPASRRTRQGAYTDEQSNWTQSEVGSPTSRRQSREPSGHWTDFEDGSIKGRQVNFDEADAFDPQNPASRNRSREFSGKFSRSRSVSRSESRDFGGSPVASRNVSREFGVEPRSGSRTSLLRKSANRTNTNGDRHTTAGSNWLRNWFG